MFTGNRQVLLELYLKHITAKPRRIPESVTPLLHDPWDSSEPMEVDKNSEISESLKSEKISDIPEFSFIQHLRRLQTRGNRKRPATSSSSEYNQTCNISSDSDSKSSRDSKVPRLDESVSKPEKKKTQKITWP